MLRLTVLLWPAHAARRKSKRRQVLRFKELQGKTVEFIEMRADAEFPCVEIGFADKTALLVLVDARLTMQPEYSRWKQGNQRLFRQWPVIDCR